MTNKPSSILLVFLLLAIIAVFLWPVLFGHKIYTGGDTVLYWYPLYGFYAHELHLGQGIPAWLPGIYSGYQGLINQLGFYNPLMRFLFSIGNSMTAFNWFGFINLSLAAIFMFFFTGSFLKSKKVAFFCAVCYALSQPLAPDAASTSVSTSQWLLPFIFWCTYKISQNIRWVIFPLAFAFVVGATTAQPQFFVYVTIAGLMFAFFLDYISGYGHSLKRLKNTGQFISSLILGAIIASPYLIRVYQLSRASFRAAGYSYAAASSGGVNPMFDFVRFIFPQFSAIFSSEGGLFFIGLPAAILLFSVFFIPSKSKLLNFFIFLAGFSLLSAVNHSPTFWFMHLFPVLNAFKEPSRWTFIFVFSAVLLSGFSLQYLVESGDARFKLILRRVSWIFLVIGILLVALFNIIIGLLGQKFVPMFVKLAQHLKYGGAHINYFTYASSITRYLENFKNVLSIRNPAVIVTIISLALCVLIFCFLKKSKITMKYFLISVILLSVVDFLVLWGLIYYPGNYADRSLLTNAPETAKFILTNEKNTPAPFRIYRFYPGFSPYVKLKLLSDTSTNRFLLDKEMLASNLNVLYGIDSISGYENYAEDRMDNILSYLGYEKSYKVGQYWDGESTLEDKLKYFNDPQKLALMSMMNVKYVLSSFPLSKTLFKIYETKVFAVPVFVYQNPDVIARAYFPRRMVCTPVSDKQKLFNILLSIKDYHLSALLETDKCNQEVGPSVVKIATERNGLTDYVIQTETNGGGYMVLGESFASNWRAYVDGAETKIYRANYIYQAVFVPVGKHKLEFVFKGN